jgi:3,4-dihydroxy 2-butanone 4-phosphate synthase/GTP cyclohydrolase II
MKAPAKKTAVRKPAPKKTRAGIDSIDDVLRDIRAGKPVIVVDDAERENEGDLVLAAEKASAESVNFMMRFGRGLICAPITSERAARLGLNRMVLDNRESFKTDFTVSVDATENITTGIHPHPRRSPIAAGRPRPARPHFSPARQGGRGAPAQRPHRGCRRSRAPGGP